MPRVPQRSLQRAPPTAACTACVDDDHPPPTELRQDPGPLQLKRRPAGLSHTLTSCSSRGDQPPDPAVRLPRTQKKAQTEERRPNAGSPEGVHALKINPSVKSTAETRKTLCNKLLLILTCNDRRRSEVSSLSARSQGCCHLFPSLRM